MPAEKTTSKKSILIIGAGITGLATAYYLSKNYDVTIIEKDKDIGGVSTSFKYKDFVLDYGPHKIYSEIPGIIDEMQSICQLQKIKKFNSIYLKGEYYDFPLKITQILKKMPLTAFNAGTQIITKNIGKKPDDSYENYLINRFGKRLYELSFKDYAMKVWGTDPKELDPELAKRRIAVSGIMQLVKSVLFKKTENISAEYFYYPKNGMLELITALADKIKENNGKILTSENIEEINIENKKVEYIKIKNKTGKIKPDYIISTIPLNSLNYLIKDKEKNLNISQIEYKNLNIIYFILNKPRALKDCWIFFPEKEFIFQRVSEQKAFSEFTSPKDQTCIMVETCQDLDKDKINSIITQLEKTNILKKEEIKEYFFKTIVKAYPIYKKGFSSELLPLLEYIESIENFYTLGRQGLFNYNNTDQCWDMALKVTDQIKNNKTKADWQKTKEYFEKYRIVD